MRYTSSSSERPHNLRGDVLVIALMGLRGELVTGTVMVVGRQWRQGEEVMEATREVSLESAECALLCFAVGLLAGEILLGCRAVSGAGDGDDVQGVVELAVTAAVETVLGALPGGPRDQSGASQPRRTPGRPGLATRPPIAFTRRRRLVCVPTDSLEDIPSAELAQCARCHDLPQATRSTRQPDSMRLSFGLHNADG